MTTKLFGNSTIRSLAAPRLGIMAACLLLAGTVPSTHAGKSGGGTVLPPQSHPFGKSLTEWSEEHWRWVYSIPVTGHPAFQDGVIDLSQDQPSGPVWFLIGSFSATPVAGGFSASANRTATIPHGKTLFFPIIDAEASTAEGNGSTESDLLAAARGFLDPVSNLACEIDGESVPNLQRYRFETPIFTWGPLPADNLLGLPEGTVTDRYRQGIS